ncbi:hypothetical protein BJ322DRAFT_1111749 [Thelephora terrestris]|uniref:Uncharacterized protein n=1 Tax=Thelephora terrestris TaxID=56493 RepID=A0A9P6HA86_9AGAM|nr:hypothetical protein BJ322DRAFT_1111749 [Thelephora terrestris]
MAAYGNAEAEVDVEYFPAVQILNERGDYSDLMGVLPPWIRLLLKKFHRWYPKGSVSTVNPAGIAIPAPKLDQNFKSSLIRLSDTRTTQSEPLERVRIQTLERTLARERAVKEAEKNDRIEMRSRLDIWDDDESDELMYTGRPCWRTMQTRSLAAEESADNESRVFEEREAKNLRRESELFLARQMDEMHALQEK